MKEFIDKKNTIAVVGASRNKEKYGYKIYKALKNNNYKVYPINPNAEEIDGDKCYKRLADVPEKIDVVITITKPEITKKIVEEIAKLNIKKIWMQPGSESDQAKKLCEEKGIKYMSEMCFVVDGLEMDLNSALKLEI